MSNNRPAGSVGKDDSRLQSKGNALAIVDVGRVAHVVIEGVFDEQVSRLVRLPIKNVCQAAPVR